MSMKPDQLYMQRALALARKGEGRTHPNPPVGAVLTVKGKIVGEGFHKKAGMPHAEVEAIRSSSINTRNGTLYVTLEPCSTIGKTPACTVAIINAGIKRVVVGVKDPNPKHYGRGIRALRKAGVKVEMSKNHDAANELIAPFATWVLTGRPLVTLKLGMTIDGRIADSTGKSQWITGSKSRSAVQNLRKRVDAVIVGCGTAVTDDPSLLSDGRRDDSLRRVIVDSTGRLPFASKVLNDGNAASTILATTKKCPASRVIKYEAKGAEVWVLQSSGGGVSIPRLISRLGKEGLTHVLCEGGGELAYSLIKANAVDEYIFFIAPKVLGGTCSVPAVGGTGWMLDNVPELDFTMIEKLGRDVMLKARPRRHQ